MTLTRKYLLLRSVFLISCLLNSPHCFSILFLNKDFPTTNKISDNIHFWEKIFEHYDSNQAVIHDRNNPKLVIDIINFKEFNNTQLSFEKITHAYLKRYNLALKRFRQLKIKAQKHGPIEQRIWHIYGKKREHRKLLFGGKVKIRSQRGLSDEFIRAANRAQKHLPQMEKIFNDHKIPPILTRLVFVESMFNTNARSKAGAVGLWQIMPTTAKKYLHINKMVDERKSPRKATTTAAKLLKTSQKKLRSWPLSITSYNFGLNGILRAVKKLKTRSFDYIVSNYKSPRFGYASKNFYAEFIAAVNSYNKLILKNKIAVNYIKESLIHIKLKERLSLQELINRTGIRTSIIKKYNPCLKNRAFTKLKKQKLPLLYEITLPKKLASYASKRLVRSRS